MLIIVGAVPIILAFSLGGYMKARRDLQQAFPVTFYKAEAEWLREHSEDGSIVLHNDWDDWPVLFYHSRHNRYIVGLDPTFMYLHDPQLYRQYALITTGQLNDPATVIKETFDAKYVLVDGYHHLFREKLDADPSARLVFDGPDAAIYYIDL